MSWIEECRSELIRIRGGSRGWPYRLYGELSAEATAMAGLALLSHSRWLGQSDSRQMILEAATWLASMQNPDGSVGICPGSAKPGWPTPLVVLLWANLEGFVHHQKMAIEWLVSMKGKTAPRETGGPVGHDTSIDGWSWADDVSGNS